MSGRNDSPDGEGHLSYHKSCRVEQLIEKYGEEYRDKIGGKYTHADGTHCYVGALFEELGYPLPQCGKILQTVRPLAESSLG